ncbi:MAG: hypothetical protein AB1416_13285, partial [Actinomycetota bacterium]
MPQPLATALQRAGTGRLVRDAVLARRAAAGDDAAAEALLARHREPIERTLAVTVAVGDRVAVAAAMTMEAARAQLAAGLRDGVPPKLALLAIAVERAGFANAAPGASTPAPLAGEPAAQAALRTELASRPLPERAALALTRTVGLSAAAAAVVLGTSADHVRALALSAHEALSVAPAAGPECGPARAAISASGRVMAPSGAAHLRACAA